VGGMTLTTSFKDLEVWQESMTLVEEIYALSKSFPREELFGLTSQLRKAAVTIPSNIGEGSRRNVVECCSIIWISRSAHRGKSMCRSKSPSVSGTVPLPTTLGFRSVWIESEGCSMD
jgi:hypothetical protein